MEQIEDQVHSAQAQEIASRAGIPMMGGHPGMSQQFPGTTLEDFEQAVLILTQELDTLKAAFRNNHGFEPQLGLMEREILFFSQADVDDYRAISSIAREVTMWQGRFAMRIWNGRFQDEDDRKSIEEHRDWSQALQDRYDKVVTREGDRTEDQIKIIRDGWEVRSVFRRLEAVKHHIQINTPEEEVSVEEVSASANVQRDENAWADRLCDSLLKEVDREIRVFGGKLLEVYDPKNVKPLMELKGKALRVINNFAVQLRAAAQPESSEIQLAPVKLSDFMEGASDELTQAATSLRKGGDISRPLLKEIVERIMFTDMKLTPGVVARQMQISQPSFSRFINGKHLGRKVMTKVTTWVRAQLAE